MSRLDLHLRRIPRQSSRFADALFSNGATQAAANKARTRFADGSEALYRYERSVAQVYEELAFTNVTRMRLNPMSRRIYGLSRRCQGEKFWQLLAVCVYDRLIEGASWTEALTVVERAMTVLGKRFNLAEADVLRGEVGRRRKDVKYQSANGKWQNGEGNRTEGTMSEGNETGTKQNGVPLPDSLPVGGLLKDDVEWERGRRKLALANLRLALAGHQHVVKVVVARRICEHKSYDEIAAECGLTRSEVTEVLDKMRRWVFRFTAYFNDDWFWLEGGSKFIMPEH